MLQLLNMATVIVPGQKLSQFNDEFMKELEDDFQSPGSSKFQNYMNQCRVGMQKMEEVGTQYLQGSLPLVALYVNNHSTGRLVACACIHNVHVHVQDEYPVHASIELSCTCTCIHVPIQILLK